MKTAELLIPQSSSPSPRRQEPHWDNRIAARLLALRIDRDLAEVTPSASPVTRAARGRLRTAEPVDARGVAMLRAILADGGGPCYVRSHSATLTVRLKEVSRCLRVAY